MNGRTFAFGKNWQAFIKHYLNQARIHEAKKSLTEFYGSDNFLKGKTFVDVGCGSGLFSLAAYQLGASKIMSFDVDVDAVRCCEYLRKKEGDPDNWHVSQGSILDKEFVSRFGKYDFVYSWGVLHHTGDMWKAIENTADIVANGGLLYLAIYNKVDYWGIDRDGRFGSSSFWLREKKIYSRLPLFLQNCIDYGAMVAMIFLYLVTLNNPIKKICGHQENRGMSWRIDIKDWLGGYPYEYASVDEIFHFIKKRGFVLENLKSSNGLRNNEYLFRKT